MKEIDFYPEFAEKFVDYLKGYLPSEIRISYSCNKSLDSMIQEIESQLSVKIDFQNEYIPKLKLDVLFAFEKAGQVHLVLIEAKYLSQLSLQNYSQLSGYLQVAKNISTGILVLINKGHSVNRLSNDFNEIIQLEKLPMDWTQLVKSKQYQFQTGIVTFQSGNGIEWIDTSELSGISSFQQLAELIEREI